MDAIRCAKLYVYDPRALFHKCRDSKLNLLQECARFWSRFMKKLLSISFCCCCERSHNPKLNNVPNNHLKQKRWRNRWMDSISGLKLVQNDQSLYYIGNRFVRFVEQGSQRTHNQPQWLRIRDWPHTSYHHFRSEQH